MVDLIETIGAEIHLLLTLERIASRPCINTRAGVAAREERSLIVDMSRMHIFDKRNKGGPVDE